MENLQKTKNKSNLKNDGKLNDLIKKIMARRFVKVFLKSKSAYLILDKHVFMQQIEGCVCMNKMMFHFVFGISHQ